VADVEAALTYLGARPEVDPVRLGLYGTSYGGATVVWVAAINPRVTCMVSVVGIGHGGRWMRSVRRPDEWFDLLARAEADRIQRVRVGQSELVERSEILLPDRQSAELAAAARRNNPAAVNRIRLEYVDDTLGFNPEWVVDKIAPRPVLFITTDGDRPARGVRTPLRPRRGAEETRCAPRLRPLRGLRRACVQPRHAGDARLVSPVPAGAVNGVRRGRHRR
jgi:pimeloyl-ACP methyl ester carboxylesterase